MSKLSSVIGLVFFSSVLIALMGYVQGATPPTVSTDIYDVKSRDEIHKFSAGAVRRLVQIENARPQGRGTVPHKILVYCFDEETFRYTGGKYQNEEIKYRLHTPKNVRSGRKYPLIVHLHGIGEAGSNNTSSLVHLHSILPVLVGPESENFFMLVTQCPAETPGWSFRPSTKDGTLDVLTAVMEHVIAEHPIDTKRITTTGVSSGGWGVWELLLRYPDMFAGAVPTSCGAPAQLQKLAALKKTPIWSFVNKGDVDPGSNQAAMRVISGAGGSMAVTECDASGHNAWRPAMEDYNCFRWLLAQKRGSWFSPPPDTIVYQPNSWLFILVMYIVPLAIIVFFVFQSWSTIYDRVSDMYQAVRERISNR
jgi:predicted esterase